MIRIPLLISCPQNILPDGVVRLAAGPATAEQLGPYAREADPLADTRLWVSELGLWVEWRSTTAESIGCSFFSEDWSESLGGDATGTGSHYSSMELTYESLVSPPVGAPHTETITQSQTVTHQIAEDGTQSCELVSDPEELPDPPTHGLPWTLAGVTFSDALPENHRFDWALAVVEVIHELPGSSWTRQDHVAAVESGPVIESDDITAAALTVRFLIETADGVEQVPYDHGGTVQFSYKIENTDTGNITYQDHDLNMAPILANGTISEATEETTIYTGMWDRIELHGPPVTLAGEVNTVTGDQETILVKRAGVLPPLQPGHQRYESAASSGQDPRNPNTGLAYSYAGTVQMSRTPGAPNEWTINRTGGFVTPPVMIGVAAAPESLSGLSVAPGLRNASDVDDPALPRRTRTATVWLAEGSRRVGGESMPHLHRIDYSGLSSEDLVALSDSLPPDGTGDEAFAGLGHVSAASFAPDHELTRLKGRTWIPEGDLALLWYHSHDEEGVTIGRRAILPNGPDDPGNVGIVTVHGSVRNAQGESIEPFALLLDQTDPDHDGLGAWLETENENTCKAIERVAVDWTTPESRLAYPLALATGATL